MQIGGGAFFGCSKELKLYGAEGAPAQQYAKLNGLTFDSQSWQDDEDLVLAEEEDGTLTVTGARQKRRRTASRFRQSCAAGGLRKSTAQGVLCQRYA